MVAEVLNKLKNNKKLTKEEINYIVNNYMNGNISDKEMSEFLLLVKEKGLTFKETFYLTLAMVNSGEVLSLDKINKVVVDKHSTGGVGDKVTFLVSPIVASLNLGALKMSGRSLGLTGGTIDKLMSIPGYKVNISDEELVRNINTVGISVISQTTSLAPADKKIYALRDEIGAVDSIPLIASSIMSKKIASGAKYIVIDLKVGKGAFMKNEKEAKTLAKYMIKIGKYFNRKVVCILTDMNNPLGTSVGNSLEVKEAEDFFNGNRDERLFKLVLTISSYMVSLGKKISLNKARKLCLEVLNNGKAKDKFYEWISNQGGNINKINVAKNILEVKSTKDGYITNIDPYIISKLVYDIGAGRKKKEDVIDYTVGVTIEKKLYEKVCKGDTLIKIYYNNKKVNEEEVLRAFKIESIIENKKDIIINVIK